MKLKTIQAAGLKGGSFKHDLSPVTVFVGPSMSGKTRILDAVRLGLLGYHPKLGKRPGDTLRLGQGGKLGVRLEFDGMGPIERAWNSNTGVARAHGYEGPVVPTVGLDVREYFGMTGPERMRYVFAQIDMSDALSKEQLLARLQCVTPKDKPADGFITAVSDMARIVIDLDAARIEEDVSTQAFVDELIATFTEAKKAADAACKQFAGLSQGSAQLRAAADEAPARNVQAALAKEREEVGRLRGLVNSTRMALDYNRKTEARKVWLEWVTVSDTSEQQARLRAEIVALEVTSKGDPDANKLTMRQSLAFDMELKNAEGEAATLMTALWQLVATHNGNMAHKSCPVCKAKGTAWKKSMAKDFEAEKDLLELDFDKATKRAKEAKAAHKAATAAFVASQEVERVATNYRNVLVSKRIELDNLLAVDQMIAGHMAELKALRDRPEQAATQDVLDEQESALAAAAARVDALAHEDRRYVAAKAREAQTHEANAAHAVQQARAEVFKLAIASVRELQQEMIDKAIGGLLAVANKFTAGILRGPLDYKDGDIGYWRDAGYDPGTRSHSTTAWVSHECFSGTETALAYAGLSVALAQRSPFKLVMIDELGIVDATVKGKILARMVELQKAGAIDQFIGADVAKELWQPGVEVVEVA